MKLAIGETIASHRRARGMTQEALATSLGVSAAAVSKWETGQSYPDIALLPPLARLFDLSVDDLLAFTPQLTESARGALVDTIGGLFADEGWAHGLDACDALLREHPTDMELRILLASELMQNLALAPDEAARDEGRARQVRWLREATQSTEGRTQLLARNLLGVFYMHARRLDEAEAIFTDMLDLPPPARQMLPTLRMLQGRHEEALRLAQGQLLGLLMDTSTMLSTMTSLAAKLDDAERAAYYARAQESLLERFGLARSYPALSAAQSAWIAAQAAQDREALINATVRYAEAVLHTEAPAQGLYFDLMSETPAPMREGLSQSLHALMADELMANPAYESIREDARIQAVVHRLRARA